MSGVLVIRDQCDAAGLEHPRNLSAGEDAPNIIWDIVQAKVRQNDVEAPWGKAHLARALAAQFCLFLHTLKSKVLLRLFNRVAGEILGAPDIDPHPAP